MQDFNAQELANTRCAMARTGTRKPAVLEALREAAAEVVDALLVDLKRLQCSGGHAHEAAEGRSKTTRSANYPAKLACVFAFDTTR